MTQPPPPPPYTETDIYSVSGGTRSVNLTPAFSHAEIASTAPRSEYAASSVEGSTIYTPPYTPDGSCLFNSSGLPDEAGSDPTVSTSAASYFESRFRAPVDDILLVHEVIFTRNAHPRDLPYPEPESEWLRRDVTKQDWATFLNYLLPHHIDAHNGEVADRKMMAELVDDRMQRLTFEDGRSRNALSEADAQLAPLRQNSGLISNLEAVVAEWNEGFFGPRCVHIDVIKTEEPVEPVEPERSVDDISSMVPGAWSETEPIAENPQHEIRGSGRGRGGPGGWVRADNSGFHVGRGLISADTNGFRIGKSALVADSNGFRIGKLLRADSNGFRLGHIVADSNGLRIGGLNLGGAALLPQARPTKSPAEIIRGVTNVSGSYQTVGDQNTKSQKPDNQRGRSFDHTAPLAQHRSHSTSSSMSSLSSASEGSIGSIGSLPDYDHLDAAQLPVAKNSIQKWLDHPDQPITKEAVEEARIQLRDAIIAQSNAIVTRKEGDTPASKEAEMKVLRKEVKAMLDQFHKLKRAQAAKQRAERREKRQVRRAAKKERRETKRQARTSRREGRRMAKGKGREVQQSPIQDAKPDFKVTSGPPILNPGTLPKRASTTSPTSSQPASNPPPYQSTVPIPEPSVSPELPPSFGVLGLNPNQQSGSIARARAEANRLMAEASRQTAEISRRASQQTAELARRASHQLAEQTSRSSRQVTELHRQQSVNMQNQRNGNNNRPPIPLSGEAQRLWNEAQRIRGDIAILNDDAKRTLEKADMYSNGGNISAEQEKMSLKLRDVVEGLLEESEKLEEEVKRLEAKALRMGEEGELNS